jgi:hypothetical protein
MGKGPFWLSFDSYLSRRYRSTSPPVIAPTDRPSIDTIPGSGVE